MFFYFATWAKLCYVRLARETIFLTLGVIATRARVETKRRRA